MTIQEHIREAQRLVEHSKNHTDQGNEADDRIAALAAAQAQVHATLATVNEDAMQLWESLRVHMLDRIEQDRSVDVFRRVWQEADARGEHGERVRQALAAVVREVLL